MLIELEKSEERDRQRVLEEATSILQGNASDSSDCNKKSDVDFSDINEKISKQGENTEDAKSDTEILQHKDNGQGDGQEETSLQPGFCFPILSGDLKILFMYSLTTLLT